MGGLPGLALPPTVGLRDHVTWSQVLRNYPNGWGLKGAPMAGLPGLRLQDGGGAAGT